MPVFLLNDSNDNLDFPPPHLASDIGLLAVGGDLSQERLLHAYRKGIFPWFSEDEPIMWWSPDPRLVLYPNETRISRSLQRVINKKPFKVTLDAAFEEVINGCARIRRENDAGTWITPDMIEAYCRLHRNGYAHSVEAWYEGELVGGLYGITLGRCFFGESMFSRVSNASKVAFAILARHLQALSFDIIDCQVSADHLKQFGAREIPRSRFLAQLEQFLEGPGGNAPDGSLITRLTKDPRLLSDG